MVNQTLEQVVYPSIKMAECPFPFYDHLLTHAPVYQVPGRPHEYLVSRDEDVMFVLSHPELFSNETDHHTEGGRTVGEVTASTLATDPPKHGKQRKLIIRPFTPGRLKQQRLMVQRVVDRLIDGFIDTGRCDFAIDFANPLPIQVTCNLMGLPEEDFEWFRASGQLEGNGTTYRDEEEQARQHANGIKMGEYIADALQRRHESPTDDAISEIMQLQIERDGELKLPYLIGEVGLLLAGGVVTTAHALSSAMLLLLQNPAQMAEVRADHGKISRMFEEAMRVESPVQWQPRRCVKDTEIAGVVVPAGASVLFVMQSANRDERVFECRERFDVRRKNVKSPVAFGYGHHFCLGAPLARLEAEIGFKTLFARVGDIRLSPSQTDFGHLESVTFRGPKHVLIEFDLLERTDPAIS